MANVTDTAARNIHGTDPQNLVEKIIRTRAYETMYWKQHCFALTAVSLLDKAIDLQYVGGTFGGNRRPTKFMCLLLKMLQIQPDKEIVIEYILNDDYKYVRLLGAFYLRLTGKAVEIYQYLEPLLNDYRKLRERDTSGQYKLTHMDELIDDMLTKDAMLDIVLPRIATRIQLEKEGERLMHCV